MTLAALMVRGRDELNLFWLAMGFLTRIPMPATVRFSPAALNRCCRYFSLVGWLLGALLALLFITAEALFGQSLAVLLMLAGSLFLTGAFHEDGLADTFDGLGGGLTIKQKLAIMKDSRIGTYGAVALLMAQLIKWQALVNLGEQAVWAILVVAAVSRAFSTALMSALPYVTEDLVSKSKPLVTRADPRDLAVVLLLAVVPALLLAPLESLLCLAGLLLLGWCLVRFYRRSLGGYTGDMLGAAQQFSEIACYLILLTLW